VKDRTAAGFCAVFLLAMVLVPLWQLRIPYQSRQIGHFGWQMYARDHGLPRFVAHFADGRPPAPASPPYWSTWWGDGDLRAAFVARICQETGAARIVATKPHLPLYHEEFPCP
jgi:hypothetical protein